MWPTTETVPLPTNVFTILRDLIHERAGIFFDDQKRDLLADKLSARLTEHGFTSFLDYYYLLKYGPEADQEWLFAMDALSVQETYFWREVAQIRALVTRILPDYVAAHPDRPLEIWSAACATGEEPLTVAMVLAEAGWFEKADVRIVGSDASNAAIAKARQGLYRERSFRAIPQSLHEKYFTAASGGWRVSDELASRVSYKQANLLNAQEIEPFVRSPFVFCRNVFIYFSPEAISLTVRHFANKMHRPGYLFISASESLLRLSTDFELEPAGDAFVYYLRE
jgi:chemotaxis protein methyltransferase CheR